MRKKDKKIVKILGIILTIILIIGGFIAILNFFGINSFRDIPSIPNSDTFQISISPSSINEGQYDKGYPFEIIITPNSQLNITYFELKKSNILIDRKNKNTQPAISSGFCITQNYYPAPDCYFDSFFSCSTLSSSYYPENCNKQYSVSVILSGCPNCFYGSSFPYQITFNIVYSVDNIKKTFTKYIEIPIND